jgi:hypothetical protein
VPEASTTEEVVKESTSGTVRQEGHRSRLLANRAIPCFEEDPTLLSQQRAVQEV